MLYTQRFHTQEMATWRRYLANNTEVCFYRNILVDFLWFLEEEVLKICSCPVFLLFSAYEPSVISWFLIYLVDTVTPETSSGESPAEFASEIPPQYDVACTIGNPLPAVPMRMEQRLVLHSLGIVLSLFE